MLHSEQCLAYSGHPVIHPGMDSGIATVEHSQHPGGGCCRASDDSMGAKGVRTKTEVY